MLAIHNTLTGRRETFKPLVAGTARIYVCGVTVYDECHLGHARNALVFEILRTYLEYSGYRVTFVKNFTDVDDKIIARAAQENVTWTEIVDRYLATYRRDMERLGIRAADIEPRATEHIADIVRLIQRLIDKGHAYRVDGDVYYAVETYPSYGQLSKRKVDELLAGARVEIDDRKRNPLDFALWKMAKPDEPAWDSPWGTGRPGWHIECSAMAMRHLGETFDIHGGGMDLIFPHHENEIAQSTGATGQTLARFWLHNGFVQINQEKMSKSLGNFFTIREVFEKWPYPEHVTAEVLRYFLIATHYRSPLEFSDQALQEAKRALDGLYGLFQRLEEPSAETRSDPALKDVLDLTEEGFRHAMDDDLNTSAAIAQLQKLRAEVNGMLASGLSSHGRTETLKRFRKFGHVLGLLQVPIEDWEFKERIVGAPSAVGTGSRARRQVSDAEIQRQLEERNAARQRKDFARADAIRAALAAQGITIEDRPDGTSRWKR